MRANQFVIAIVAALSCSFGAMPAQAQDAGSDSAWNQRLSKGEVRAIHRFADCAVDRDAPMVRAALESGVESSDSDRRFEALVENESVCTSTYTAFSFGNAVLAGALAENMLRARDALGHLLDTALTAGPDGPRVTARDSMEAVGICVARHAPRDVKTLLLSAPGSAGESGAIGQLGPALADCLPARQTARFSKPGLRALVALSVYRIVSSSGH